MHVCNCKYFGCQRPSCMRFNEAPLKLQMQLNICDVRRRRIHSLDITSIICDAYLPHTSYQVHIVFVVQSYLFNDRWSNTIFSNDKSVDCRVLHILFRWLTWFVESTTFSFSLQFTVCLLAAAVAAVDIIFRW